jgi:hypothetical protein
MQSERKNGESKKLDSFLPSASNGGGELIKMRKMQAFIAMGVLGAGFMLAGCKSTPSLSKDQALALIQAKYDAAPPAPFTIAVNDLGMQEGVTAKYWVGLKRYPNGYWGDFKLTPDGKKVLTLVNGGDTIQWRPEGPTDDHYVVAITTVSSNRLKAKNIGEIQDQPGGTKMADFTEDVVLTGVPGPLQGIAHNPGNQLSTNRTAIFVLNNGAWTLQSID